MSRKDILSKLILTLALVGVGFVAYPFIASLKPTPSAIYEWQTEIETADHRPGELKSYELFIGTVWVYHRTQQEIEWFATYQPPEIADYIRKNVQSESFNGNYRSVSPEYFVFTSWNIRDKTYLQTENAWYPCGTIEYHSGEISVEISVSENRSFKGVIACLYNHRNTEKQNNKHVYDIAGMPKTSNIAPLSVPYYKINYRGNIIVGPKP